ncbi:MAG: N-formylglutamate amidohydrolase [Geminicoccaceae bacterium]
MNPADPPLLTPNDPPPVTLVNAGGHAPLVLTCEHGGRAVPASLQGSAPPAKQMRRHIAYDPGAANVARALAFRLDAPLTIQPFSRLVIDCNRPRQAPDLASAESDGSVISFNQSLDDDALEVRWRAIHQPFHKAVSELITARGKPALLAVHSFTRQLQNQPPRTMAIGLLSRQDKSFKERLRNEMLAIRSDLPVVLDAPYQIEDASDYTIPIHAEPRGLPHLLLEVRNDLISDENGVTAMVDLLSSAVTATLPSVTLPET